MHSERDFHRRRPSDAQWITLLPRPLSTTLNQCRIHVELTACETLL